MMHIFQCLISQERGAFIGQGIIHVIQTSFSECKASWHREAAQSGCSLLHSAAQSLFGKARL